MKLMFLDVTKAEFLFLNKSNTSQVTKLFIKALQQSRTVTCDCDRE